MISFCVKQRQFSPHLMFFGNPNAVSKSDQLCTMAPLCGCHRRKAPTMELIDRHEREIIRRMAWCIKNGHVPANEHVHLAPGCDENFVYGVPPFQSDGSPNPAGIYTQPISQYDKDLSAASKNQATGWGCTSCGNWVPVPPRPYVKGEEPHDWWWCFTCKATKSKPSKIQLRREKEARSCHVITDMLY